MCCGMCLSWTSRRFSRPDETSAVMSGGSSVSCSGRVFCADDLEVVDGGRFLGLCRPHAEDDADGLALPVAVARDEDDGIAADRELAGLPGLGAVGIAKLVQPVDQLAGRHRLTAPDLERPREHARVDPLHLPVQPGVDHPGEDDVVVAEHPQEHHERPRQRHERVELPPRVRAA